MLDSLYQFAKFQYECGNYASAADNLYFYRVLVSLSLRNYEELQLWNIHTVKFISMQSMCESTNLHVSHCKGYLLPFC